MYSYKELEIEAKAIKKDIREATKIVEKSIVDYKKRMLKARNKKQIENPDMIFEKLGDYQSKLDIQDAWGWNSITEKERDKLFELWDTREVVKNNAGKYQDRVTEMLECTIRRIGDEYRDIIDEFENQEAQNNRNQWEINKF